MFPARDKLTSFVALRVDAERLRGEFLPAFVTGKPEDRRRADRLSAARA